MNIYNLITDWNSVFNLDTSEVFSSSIRLCSDTPNDDLVYKKNIYYESDQNRFKIVKWRSIIPEYNNVIYFLLSSNIKSGFNYFHFNFHYIQKILPYLKNKKNFQNVKILINANLLDWQKEILLFFIDKEDLIEINIRENNQLILRQSYYFQITCFSSLNPDLYEYYFKPIQKNDIIFETKNIVYLSRYTKNCGGKNRFILNNDLFLEYIEKTKIMMVTLPESVFKKYEIFDNNPRILIINWGSDIVNLLFLDYESIKKINFIFLIPKNWHNNNKLFDQSRMFSIIKFLKLNHKYILLKQTPIENESDKLNYPVTIDIDELNTIIESFN